MPEGRTTSLPQLKASRDAYKGALVCILIVALPLLAWGVIDGRAHAQGPDRKKPGLKSWLGRIGIRRPGSASERNESTNRFMEMARQILGEAHKLAAEGNIEGAIQLARRADTLTRVTANATPVRWKPGEQHPSEFLQELLAIQPQPQFEESPPVANHQSRNWENAALDERETAIVRNDLNPASTFGPIGQTNLERMSEDEGFAPFSDLADGTTAIEATTLEMNDVSHVVTADVGLPANSVNLVASVEENADPFVNDARHGNDSFRPQWLPPNQNVGTGPGNDRPTSIPHWDPMPPMQPTPPPPTQSAAFVETVPDPNREVSVEYFDQSHEEDSSTLMAPSVVQHSSVETQAEQFIHLAAPGVSHLSLRRGGYPSGQNDGAAKSDEPTLLTVALLQTVSTFAGLLLALIVFFVARFVIVKKFGDRLGIAAQSDYIHSLVVRQLLQSRSTNSQVSGEAAVEKDADFAAVSFGDTPFPFRVVGTTYAEEKEEEERRQSEREQAMIRHIFEENLRLQDDLDKLEISVA